MPEFNAELAREEDRAHDVFFGTASATFTLTAVGYGHAEKTATNGPEFMSIDGTEVKWEEFRLNVDGRLIALWATEDLWDGHLDFGLY